MKELGSLYGYDVVQTEDETGIKIGIKSGHITNWYTPSRAWEFLQSVVKERPRIPSPSKHLGFAIYPIARPASFSTDPVREVYVTIVGTKPAYDKLKYTINRNEGDLFVGTVEDALRIISEKYTDKATVYISKTSAYAQLRDPLFKVLDTVHNPGRMGRGSTTSGNFLLRTPRVL